MKHLLVALSLLAFTPSYAASPPLRPPGRYIIVLVPLIGHAQPNIPFRGRTFDDEETCFAHAVELNAVAKAELDKRHAPATYIATCEAEADI